MQTKLKIMTYNVQWFAGVNGQLDMQKKIINKHQSDIIGIQELSTNGKINSVGKAVLSGYGNLYLSNHKNFLGLASKFVLKDVKHHEFKHQDPDDMILYGETRAYTTAWLEIDLKKIKIINTHLCYLTPEVKYQQMKEIFNSAEQSEYAIITGDFNCFDDYDRMFKRFIDSGYNLANSRDKIVKTWTNKVNPKSLYDFTYPTDNIITSKNIAIKKVKFDNTKLRYPNGNPMDHIPIIVRVYIK